MQLTLIAGGRAEAATAERELPNADAVRQEAARRLRSCGYEMARVRALLGGPPMPLSLRYLQMQTAYAADSLAALRPIPPDFRSDRYWPRVDPPPEGIA